MSFNLLIEMAPCSGLADTCAAPRGMLASSLALAPLCAGHPAMHGSRPHRQRLPPQLRHGPWTPPPACHARTAHPKCSRLPPASRHAAAPNVHAPHEQQWCKLRCLVHAVHAGAPCSSHAWMERRLRPPPPPLFASAPPSPPPPPPTPPREMDECIRAWAGVG